MTPLLERRFIAVAGKGGVGRTTVAATLAALAARRGKKVLLCQVNARERISLLLGGDRLGPVISRVRDRIDAVNMLPKDALHEYGVMVLKYERIYRAVFENRMARTFLRAIPGLDEYSMIGKAWYHTTEMEGGRPRWDLVILDLQATGHAVTMLRLPQTILEAVADGPLVRDARLVCDLLRDPHRSGMMLVTLAEEMPTTEAIELYGIARSQLGMSVAAVVVNMIWPSRFESGAPKEILGCLASDAMAMADPRLAPVVERARMAERRAEINATYIARLRHSIPTLHVQLPYVFSSSFGPPQIESLAGELGRQL